METNSASAPRLLVHTSIKVLFKNSCKHNKKNNKLNKNEYDMFITLFYFTTVGTGAEPKCGHYF